MKEQNIYEEIGNSGIIRNTNNCPKITFNSKRVYDHIRSSIKDLECGKLIKENSFINNRKCDISQFNVGINEYATALFNRKKTLEPKMILKISKRENSEIKPIINTQLENNQRRIIKNYRTLRKVNNNLE